MIAENNEEITLWYRRLREHVMSHLVYPELQYVQNKFNLVPVYIHITDQWELESVDCKIYTKYPEQNWIKATDTKFIQEATAIIKAFDSWIPDKIDGQHINSERYFPISFYYHERTLNDPTIVLNPDVRPKCLDTTWRYNYYVHSKNGHDGAGTILAIINEDGSPESIESYHIIGKTNQQMVEGSFKQLGQWTPAVHDGVKVKSQVSLTIYT